MRFHVPQFIDVEDKIFGPFTLKQFIYLAGGVGAAVALWFLVPWKLIAIILIGPVVVFALALAFYKYNGKPFVTFVESFVTYHTKKKLYIWQKRERRATGGTAPLPAAGRFMPHLSNSKLKEMSWDLDVANTGEQTGDRSANKQTGGDFRPVHD